MAVKISGMNQVQITTLGIGVFDGMHLGHNEIAKQCDGLLSFYPHPDLVLNKDKDIKLITLPEEIQYFFENIYFLEFTKEIASYSAEKFLDDIVMNHFKPKKIIVGYDFKFGQNKSGCTTTLRDWGKKNNIDVEEIKPFSIRDLGIIKSSKIRTLIMNGEIEKANQFLGHDYLFRGKVINGEGRGKSIGFPTANIAIHPHKCTPKPGVYGGIVELFNKEYKSIIYIGSKPTFDNHEVFLEVHIPNLKKDLYDYILNIKFKSFIRNEIKFKNQDELISQIKKDIASMQ